MSDPVAGAAPISPWAPFRRRVSWAEHLREHERVSGAIQEHERAVQAFHMGPGGPEVTHLLHSPPPRRT